jgi:hypothetical protein
MVRGRQPDFRRSTQCRNLRARITHAAARS